VIPGHFFDDKVCHSPNTIFIVITLNTQEQKKVTRMQHIEAALAGQSEAQEPTKRKRGESHADQSSSNPQLCTSGNMVVEIASE
jgi:hypothetical protein